MTETKKYNVRGAEVTITASVYVSTINISISLDLSALDKNEPDHSAHQLINYVGPILAPLYQAGLSYWWCKLSRRDIRVRTGSQAKRVINHALAKIDDALAAALIARTTRKSEMVNIF